MSIRKRDDLTSFLYRVVERRAGSDDEWVHSDCGRYGRPRTYMTLGAARGQKTGAPQTRFNPETYERVPTEYAVQRAPVTDWEIVDG